MLLPGTPKVIGLIGAAGSGKTTLALHLVQAHHYVRLPFAAPLKNMLRSLGLEGAELNDPELKEMPHPLLGGKTPRYAMQTLGTDWGRRLMGPRFWADQWKTEARRLRNAHLVADDVRFQTETDAIRQMGGVLIKVERPALNGSATVPKHESEAHWSNLPHDFVILNHEGQHGKERAFGYLRQVLELASASHAAREINADTA